MFVDLKFFNGSSKALEYVGKSVVNGGDLEIIAAECVTCKKDFESRAEMRPELPLNMIVMKLTFNNEDDGEIYDDRHECLLGWMNELAQCGTNFDQFVITCSESKNDRCVYHIIASLIIQGGYNVDIRELTQKIESSTTIFQHMNELTDSDCYVSGHEVELPMSLCEETFDCIRYGGLNPLSHELVLPFRDGILGNLKKTLFEC